jgi:phosphoribosylaminoimidazole carboxylase (NCAIR synthetase)
LHIYGKKITKPHRKLGHITVLLKNKNPLEVSDKIKNIIEIKETR